MMNDNTSQNTPLISIIIAVFNGEKFLCEAVESILAQTYTNYEIILIDDGSTDNTKKIAQSFPEVKYFFQENRGVAAARNYGISKSKGGYLAFLDADDLWMPDKLELQIKAFQDDPTLDIVSGHVTQFVDPSKGKIDDRKFHFTGLPQAGYVITACLIKQNTFKKTGLFHENIRNGETISWFASMLQKNIRFELLPDVIMRRRIHGDNISLLERDKKINSMIRILKNNIDEKRKRLQDNSD